MLYRYSVCVFATNKIGDSPCANIEAETISPSGGQTEIPNPVVEWGNPYATVSSISLVWKEPSGVNPATGAIIPAVDVGYIVQ